MSPQRSLCSTCGAPIIARDDYCLRCAMDVTSKWVMWGSVLAFWVLAGLVYWGTR